MDCIFCKISNKENKSDIVYEDDKIFAIKDINPKAPVHLLIIPKEHIPSVDNVDSPTLFGELVLVAQKMAKERNLKGYKLIINVGRAGGQIIDHLHLHLLSQDTAELI